ncbi:isochorismate lyase [Marinibacterium sp. SX1]|uniref:isochorismate lyase n=1 Tax=Marinibacterium sp. SX1 TaxID=3388424 RepID=UPI003D168242
MSRRERAAGLGIRATTPGDCRELGDVRQALDSIDRDILALLGLRLGYVLEAARFKPDVAAIPAPDRVAAMLADRRDWSEAEGLSPDFTVPLFAQTIQWFIQQQTAHWQATRAAPTPTPTDDKTGPAT